MTIDSDEITVRLFAAARDKAGTDLVRLRLSLPASIGEIRATLVEVSPGLRPLAPHLLFAVGTQYMTDESVVTSPTEVVAFPPVSGG